MNLDRHKALGKDGLDSPEKVHWEERGGLEEATRNFRVVFVRIYVCTPKSTQSCFDEEYDGRTTAISRFIRVIRGL